MDAPKLVLRLPPAILRNNLTINRLHLSLGDRDQCLLVAAGYAEESQSKQEHTPRVFSGGSSGRAPLFRDKSQAPQTGRNNALDLWTFEITYCYTKMCIGF